MAKIIIVWGIHENETDTSSGAPTRFFSREDIADSASRGNGWYGGNAPVKKYHAIQMDDGKVYLLADTCPLDLDGTAARVRKTIRKQALAKLSKEEREALELDEE